MLHEAVVHVVVTSESYSIVVIKQSLTIYSPFDWHLSCFGVFLLEWREQIPVKEDQQGETYSVDNKTYHEAIVMKLCSAGSGTDRLTNGTEWDGMKFCCVSEVVFKTNGERRDYSISRVG